MNKKLLILLAVISAAAIITGCIITGTVVITFLVVPDPDPVTVTPATFEDGELTVDLNDDEDYLEYKDDIKNIDNVSFYLSVRNNQASPVTFQILIDPDTLNDWTSIEDAIDDGVDVMFSDLTLPGSSTIILDWEEATPYTSQAEEIKTILKSGVFSIYPAAIPRNNFNITIDSCIVVVTLTGGK
jgi:hypothetical protein